MTPAEKTALSPWSRVRYESSTIKSARRLPSRLLRCFLHSLYKRSSLLRSLPAVRERSVARERAEGEGEVGERLVVAVVAAVAVFSVFSDIFVVFCCFFFYLLCVLV